MEADFYQSGSGLHGGMLPRFGGGWRVGVRFCAAPGAQPELLLLPQWRWVRWVSGWRPEIGGRLGVAGPEPLLPPQEPYRAASKVKPGFLSAASDQECLQTVSAWLNRPPGRGGLAGVCHKADLSKCY